MNKNVQKLINNGFEFFYLELPDGGLEVQVVKKLSDVKIGNKATIPFDKRHSPDDILDKLCDEVLIREDFELKRINNA